VQLAAELFDALRRSKQTQGRMAEVLVSLFVESHSFKEAKTYVGHLEELTVWDSSFSRRLRKAVKDNSQISDSYTVPERVTRLIAKWKQ
jgi:hypothetical protein